MMNAADYQNFANNRADAIEKLTAFCMDNGLDYTYTDKHFSINLPQAEELPTITHVTPPSKKRDTFDISTWGEKGYVEGEEPDPEQPLSEGTPPKEQL